jgi:AraC-like DNA-binding protein
MRPIPPDDVFRRLVVIRDQLIAEPGEAMALRDLARAAGMSRFHFLRRWKEAFGVTPHEDITRLRIARAKTLLAGDRASVTDICFDLGFSSLGSFSTMFAERAGCPPSAWRKRFYQVTTAMHDRSVLVIPWCYSIRQPSLIV